MKKIQKNIERFLVIIMKIPKDFNIPTHTEFSVIDSYNVEIVPLTSQMEEKDFALVVSNKKHLKGMFGELDDWWPSDTLNKRDNYNMLIWHEEQFRKRKSFAYAIFLNKEYIGCFYIYGLEVVRKIVSVKNPNWLYIFMWTSKEYFNNGIDKLIFEHLKVWIEREWSFAKADFPGRTSPLISFSKDTASWIQCRKNETFELEKE